MLDLLEHYIYDSLPRESFATSPGLRRKVGREGELLPFYGCTAVFRLPEAAREALSGLQARLYAGAGRFFARPLEPETFHMTLHDLVNGPELTPELCRRMEAARALVQPLIEAWRGGPPLKMRATCLFNMVHTSVVLGLAPAEGESWRRLDAMYEALEAQFRLGYALTPHVTLAYYRNGAYLSGELEPLRAALGPVELEFELPMEGLAFEYFTDMNSYSAFPPSHGPEPEGPAREELLERIGRARPDDPPLLRGLPEALRADREVVLAAVKKQGMALEYAAEPLRSDREVVLAAVKKTGGALRYACPELRDDREVVLAAVRQRGNALHWASARLRGDMDLAAEALAQYAELEKEWFDDPAGNFNIRMKSNLYLHIAPELRDDPELYRRAASLSWKALREAPPAILKDPDFMRPWLNQHPDLARYIPKDEGE